MEVTIKTNKLPQTDMKERNNGIPIYITQEQVMESARKAIRHKEWVRGILAKRKAGEELTEEEAWYAKLNM